MDATTYRTEAFDQGVLLNAKYNPASSSGACHLFALKWIAEIIKNKDLGAADRIQKLKSKGGAEVKSLYKVFVDRWNNEGNFGADRDIGKMLGVTVSNPQVLNNFNQVAVVVRDAHRIGFVYSFWFSKGGAHSIGVYRSGSTWSGHIYVLEPNFGEYKMDKSQFEAWLGGFINLNYSAYGIVNAHQLRQVQLYSQPVVKFGTKV